MATKTYDTRDVIFVFAGVPLHELGGFADGEWITHEWDAQDVDKTVGADGEVAFHRVNNKVSRVTLTVMATSEINKVLIGLHQVATGSTGIVKESLQIRSGSTGEQILGADTVLQSRASISHAREPGTREWVFEIADTAMSPA